MNDTVDVVAFRGDQVLLITRGHDPYRGRHALPGGYVDPGETSRDAAAREAGEETGLKVSASQLRLVGIYDAPGRDPRGDIISTAYAVDVDEHAVARAGDDAATADWVDLARALRKPLAFDHDVILRDALSHR